MRTLSLVTAVKSFSTSSRRQSINKCLNLIHRYQRLISYLRMATWSPTLEGFRTVFRRPALSLAEVIWRWSFGLAACILCSLALLEYLNTLPVSNFDLLLLRTAHPLLVAQAFSHILQGSALRLAYTCVILFSALTVLWIALAAFGRGATLSPLLQYIRQRARSFLPESIAEAVALNAAAPALSSFRSHMRSLIGLHFLRAALALAACAAFIGAVIVTGFASPKNHPHPGMVFLLSSILTLLVWILWSSVSWFLSTASIFVVREDDDTFGALSAAADLFREHFGPILAVSSWFAGAHLVLLVVAASAVSFPLAFVRVVPPGLVLCAVLIFTLAYFAAVDALNIGRLAAYVAILEAPPVSKTSPSPLLGTPSGPQAPMSPVQLESACVDQDETILSDIPGPANSGL